MKTRSLAYVIIAAWAMLCRILVSLLAPAAFYFPDSWSYINNSTAGWPPYPLHPPTLSWIWRIGVLGSYNERNVLILQAVLGVATSVLIFSSLISLTRIRWALLISIFFTALPEQLFLERSFVTYAVEGFLIALLIRLVISFLNLNSNSLKRSGIFFVTASGVLGLAASVRPGFLVPALVLWPWMLLLWVYSQIGDRSTSNVRRFIYVPAALIAALMSPMWLAATYHQQLGVWSPAPVQGTVLFARFAPLIGCNAPVGSTALVTGSVKEVCGSRFTNPGTMRYEWVQGPLSETMTTRANFNHNQVQLRNLALAAIFHHPASASGQVLNTIWWEIARSPFSDLVDYTNGSTWFSGTLVDMGWFSGATNRSATQPIPLEEAVRNTLWLPRLLLWLSIVLGMLRLIKRKRNSERQRMDTAISTRWRRPRGDPEMYKRWSIASVCISMISLSMISIAVGAPPNWSYWVPLLPAMCVLLGLALPQARSIVQE